MIPQFAFDESGTVGHLLAGGEMVPAQLPSRSDWSPEKRLAAAVLLSTLTEIRDHHSEAQYRRRLSEDVAWISSDDTEWPYSFVPLCQVFGIDTEYLRGLVKQWLQATAPRSRSCVTIHRQAA